MTTLIGYRATSVEKDDLAYYQELSSSFSNQLLSKLFSGMEDGG